MKEHAMILDQVLSYDLNQENTTLLARAEEIIRNKRISNLDIVEDSYVSAEFEGSNGESYFVLINADENGRLKFTCDCMSYRKAVMSHHRTPKCKHILALIYYVQINKKDILKQLEEEDLEFEKTYKDIDDSNDNDFDIQECVNPEPYVEEEIEEWNPTPNPYPSQIESLEKDKRTIIRSHKKIVKYILPVAISSAVGAFLIYFHLDYWIITKKSLVGLLVPGIILLVAALIGLPFLIKAAKYNKQNNLRLRVVNRNLLDLKAKSEEFDKQQKKAKKDYDERVVRIAKENAIRKQEYEKRLAAYNAKAKLAKQSPKKEKTASLCEKEIASNKNKKLSDFSICLHATYKGYDVCSVTTKVIDNILPMYQSGFTFFDAAMGYNLIKMKESIKDPFALGFFTVGVFLSQLCGEDRFEISLRQKEKTIRFLKQKLDTQTYNQISNDSNTHLALIKKFVNDDLIEYYSEQYLDFFNIENFSDNEFETPLVLSVLPEDKIRATKEATINVDIDLETMSFASSIDKQSMFFHIDPDSQYYDFFKDISCDSPNALICQLPYRFFNKEPMNYHDLSGVAIHELTEAERDYIAEVEDNFSPVRHSEDYDSYLDFVCDGSNSFNIFEQNGHYYFLKMPIGLFETIKWSDNTECSQIDFTSDAYDDDNLAYLKSRKEYFDSNVSKPRKKESKKNATRNDNNVKDGDSMVEYIYCDEDSTVNVIKMIYNAAVNKKHKYQTDIYFLRESVLDAFGCSLESVSVFKKEDDPMLDYDEFFDATSINGDIAAKCNYDSFGFDEDDDFDDTLFVTI